MLSNQKEHSFINTSANEAGFFILNVAKIHHSFLKFKERKEDDCYFYPSNVFGTGNSSFINTIIINRINSIFISEKITPMIIFDIFDFINSSIDKMEINLDKKFINNLHKNLVNFYFNDNSSQSYLVQQYRTENSYYSLFIDSVILSSTNKDISNSFVKSCLEISKVHKDTFFYDAVENFISK